MTRLLFWVGFIWALPLTLAGLLLALVVADDCETLMPTEWAAIFRARPWFTRNFFDRFHVAAFTWGAAIHVPSVGREPVARATSPAVIAHELVHFKQARIFGVLLPLVYGVCSLVALLQGKRPYFDNWLEAWARRESGH